MPQKAQTHFYRLLTAFTEAIHELDKCHPALLANLESRHHGIKSFTDCFHIEASPVIPGKKIISRLDFHPDVPLPAPIAPEILNLFRVYFPS